MFDTDVIVIGGGQAGLAMGYYLQQQNKRFVILDQQAHVGDSWRKRYDTLVLFTPRRYSDLPGFAFPGERDQLPTKDETADYLAAYAEHFRLPIKLSTPVVRVEKQEAGFHVFTTEQVWRARSVVIATGPFHTPFIPTKDMKIAEDVISLHTAAYQNEQQLQPGPVLVVGGGNSGAQIAVELAASRPVVLSMSQSRSFLPLTILGKSIFWYLKVTGLLTRSGSSWIGKRWKEQPDPIFGYQEQMHALEQTGQLRVVERTLSIRDQTAYFADGDQATFSNLIWATGFRPSYDWLQVPGAISEEGRPVHNRGISPIKGLYYIGLPWQHSRSSALLGGVGADARYLIEHME
jgi:putative flavoprotein involved in K+ transport